MLLQGMHALAFQETPREEMGVVVSLIDASRGSVRDKMPS